MPLESWRLLDIGAIDPLETQSIYELKALPKVNQRIH